MTETKLLFDEETWAQLPTFFAHLPRPVHIIMWGDEAGSAAEKEARLLLHTLAERFETISYECLPRRVNYDYYPVLGFMGLNGDEAEDFGVRVIGLPQGFQLTTLVAAIQAVSFRGQHLGVKTRIQLKQLPTAVNLTVLTNGEDDQGPAMTTMIFNMAVANPLVRAFAIMADAFPTAMFRYSATSVPHLTINDKVHIQGVVDETEVMEHVAKAIQ